MARFDSAEFNEQTDYYDDRYLTAASPATDHGSLAGLGDDDHPQYLNAARGDLRYYTKGAVDALIPDFVSLSGQDYLSLSGSAFIAHPINLDNLSATGTASSATYLRGDNTWASITDTFTGLQDTPNAYNGQNGRLLAVNLAQDAVEFIDPLTVGVLDHGGLTGLSDDDHTQYHNDSRALTWLGTRSTSDLSEGTNLYYTEARVSANTDVSANTSSRHDSVTLAGTPNYISLSGQELTLTKLNLDDLNITGTPDGSKYLADDFSWQPVTGMGEINTYSNAGTQGVGITLTKSGVNFPFKSIAAASNKVTVVNDAGTNSIELDVDEAQLTISSMGGTLAHSSLSGIGSNTHAQIDTHISSTSNPHGVTSAQVGLGSVENTALSTWAGSSNLSTLGTISSGTWNGSAIAIGFGGTGATTASGARTNLGLGALSTLSTVGTSQIDSSAVTYAKIQDVTDNRILGRSAGSNGVVQEVQIGSGLSLSSGTLSATGGGSGEVNTASNVGTAGVGVFKQKTSEDLEFKNLNAGSNKVTITDDTGNNEIDIDVDQSNIDHDSLSGFVANEHIDWTAATVSLSTTGSGTFAGVNTSTFIELDEIAAPSTPSSGKVRLYPKSDGKLYAKADDGTEYDLTQSGGGGGASLTVNTKSNILTSTPSANGLAFSSDTNEFFVYDNTEDKWFEASLPLIENNSTEDMGAFQTNDRLGYYEGSITDKTLKSIAIGNNEDPKEGAVRVINNILQVYLNSEWANIVTNFRFREDDGGSYELEHRPIGFEDYIEVASGNGNTVDAFGYPYIQQYSSSMGAFQNRITIDGGTE